MMQLSAAPGVENSGLLVEKMKGNVNLKSEALMEIIIVAPAHIVRED
jgi:hypothetical protein